MRTSLILLALLAVVATGGCQTSKPNSPPQMTMTAKDAGAVWGNLVLGIVGDERAPSPEAFRNDLATDAAASLNTPDFVDRRWILTRRYEDLRVTNGQPGEYTSTRTQTILRGPGR